MTAVLVIVGIVLVVVGFAVLRKPAKTLPPPKKPRGTTTPKRKKRPKGLD